jgi:hypothetical protein
MALKQQVFREILWGEASEDGRLLAEGVKLTVQRPTWKDLLSLTPTRTLDGAKRGKIVRPLGYGSCGKRDCHSRS